ncbi:MAG: SusD/RagB family nutrient-binding outer membrane lipoprotein [Alistipes sp.]
MKKFIYKTKICLGIAAVFALTVSSCTSGFENFNTDPNSAQTIDKTTLITTMELDAAYPTTGETTVPVNRYQTGWNLLADHYAGYMACANHFEGGNCPMIYNLSNTWSNTVFEIAFTQVMPAWLQLNIAHEKGQITKETMALADILKVLTLHRASDMYGPLPVLKFGESRNPYDSQEVLYNYFFETLNKSITTLKAFVAITPDAKPLVKVDAIYGGDFNKWLKFANSLKLRLAMRVRYVAPSLSSQYAQEALTDGVITAVEDNALLQNYRQYTINNPLEMLWNSYNDARMGASMDSYLNGYEDPRVAKMFQVAKIQGGGFHGVRNGLGSTEQKFYTKMSAPNIAANTPMRWLLASEVAFLKAEVELTKGNIAGAETNYKEGIRLSFVENGLSSGDAAVYAEKTNTPANFTDVSENPGQPGSTRALGQVSIKWAGDGNELERVITQKWIALFPNGMEAWAEFRRTGFPKIFPIQSNSADAGINKNTQIRRMVFPKAEYANNAGAVNAATRLLGGPDNGGTKLWWDKK